MSEREKIIQLARECNIQSLKEPRYHMDIYELTGQAIEAFYHAAQREAFYHAAQKEAFEQAAKVCETDGVGAKYQGDVYAIAIRQLIKE